MKFYSKMGILNVFCHYSYAIVNNTRKTQNAFVGILGFPSHLLFVFSLLDQSLRDDSGVLGKVYLLVS